MNNSCCCSVFRLPSAIVRPPCCGSNIARRNVAPAKQIFNGLLSGGERFRCDLARVLLAGRPLVAFDEFSSVVDRTAAQIGAAAVSKAIRSGRLEQRFVAVTCHYDVLTWLEPDWVLDMASQRLSRGRLRRSELRLRIYRTRRSAWCVFERHHYLSGRLAPSARCFVGFLGETPVAFAGFLPSIGHAGVR